MQPWHFNASLLHVVFALMSISIQYLPRFAVTFSQTYRKWPEKLKIINDSKQSVPKNILQQTQLATDMMRDPRMIPASDFNYAEDIKFLEKFAIRYKQGVGLSDDAHRHYIVNVSIVLKRALSTLDDEYKNVCPWSLILKVNFADLCPHRPFCKHKQKYTSS
ncbi:hypothetical protein BPAE_0045g00560 [Botrytis paeoniae]|uniref:Uncharacterized protein n=1 Tax=Botrytis paeoniae TaxID=278948 RepID=A0A4Z1FZM7_9HELO|nr:hypothetical protein BPAE_0045g00560 [Botrytis paeoniae]